MVISCDKLIGIGPCTKCHKGWIRIDISITRGASLHIRVQNRDIIALNLDILNRDPIEVEYRVCDGNPIALYCVLLVLDDRGVGYVHFAEYRSTSAHRLWAKSEGQ